VNEMSEELAPTLERIRMYWNRLDKMIAEDSNEATKDSPLVLTMSQGVRLGLDKRGRYHLLLDLADGEEENTRRLTAGITIQTKHFQIEGTSSLWVDIIAQKRWRFAIEPFAADLVMEMKNSKIDLQTLNRLVEEYRALWRRPREPLDTRAQRGLIGEMSVVERLDPIIGFAAAVDRWEGPFNELHDIMDNDWHLEVKSYADEPPRVRISEVQQLDARIDPKLTLVGVHIMGTSKGKTLPEFIDDFLKIADLKGVHPMALEILGAAGWDEEDRDEYYSRFILGRMVLCPIHLATPVFPPHLLGQMPHSVDKITYRLALNDLFQLTGKDDVNWELACSEGDWLDTELEFTISGTHDTDQSPFNLLVETEQTYRELAHRIYVQEFGPKWWRMVPSSPKEQTKVKLREWREKGEPDLDHPSRRYWDAMTTGSLIESISNPTIWPLFEELMGVTKGTLTHHWKDFATLRNTKFHSNEPRTSAELEVGMGATKIVRSFAAKALRNMFDNTDDDE
jgi:hypothetical protein